MPTNPLSRNPGSALKDLQKYTPMNLIIWVGSDKWLLKFNVNKCCYLHYGYNDRNHTYQMYENVIQKEVVNNDMYSEKPR